MNPYYHDGFQDQRAEETEGSVWVPFKQCFDFGFKFSNDRHA